MDHGLVSSSRVSIGVAATAMFGRRAARRSCVWLALGIVAGVVVGCGEPPPKPRKALSGKVTVDGRTDFVGQIRFHPTKGNEGPVAATVVRNGSYAFTTENGPVVGRQLVVFELMVPTDAVATPADSLPKPTPAEGEGPAERPQNSPPPTDGAPEKTKAVKTLSATAYRSYERDEYIAEQTTTMDFDLK